MQKTNFEKRDALEAALGAVLGFVLFWVTSHNSSPVNKKLPVKKYKKVHYSPHIKIERKNNHLHLHHWAIFGVSYLPLLALRRRFKLNLLHGFFIGSVIQGLTYKDRFEFVKPFSDFGNDKIIDLEPMLEEGKK